MKTPKIGELYTLIDDGNPFRTYKIRVRVLEILNDWIKYQYEDTDIISSLCMKTFMEVYKP